MTLADRVVVMSKGVVQQVGTPMEIYDKPANTFVAGFIGSPTTNLVPGEIADGVLTGENIRVEGLARTARGPVTLGFRAEDTTLASEGGQIGADIYSVELLGEATMISMRVGGELVSIKTSKDYRAEIGDAVRVNIAPAACHLFDKATGTRIDTALMPTEPAQTPEDVRRAQFDAALRARHCRIRSRCRGVVQDRDMDG